MAQQQTRLPRVAGAQEPGTRREPRASYGWGRAAPRASRATGAGGAYESAEGRVGVKNTVFKSLRNPPFDVGAMQVLHDTSKRIKLPRRDGYRAFKQLFVGPTSATLLTQMFWWFHCKLFQTNSQGAQAMLMDALAETYVKLFWSLTGSTRDYFLEHFPLAASAALWAAFIEAFPSSRVEFGEQFKTAVLCEARRLFSGVEMTPQMAAAVRERYVLDRAQDDDLSNARRQQRPGEKADQGSDGPSSTSIASLLKPNVKVLRLSRVPFDAQGVTPIVNHYLSRGSDSSPAKGRPLMLKRSVPTPGCAYGGVDTFERTPSRIEIQQGITAQWDRACQDARQAKHEVRRSMGAAHSELESAKSALTQAQKPADVAQFVHDLVNGAPQDSDPGRLP